ncbi:MAG: magnesium and cobalt exporter, family [Pyrinomonadaceae bacterium]|jgi:CBS domain containing-hemolysin-like protein|nr:magnesium and cobalt exporter, family [Pyrinomonadaceae bacterium]MDQ1727914.1 magnesium and cobalt exporter, family [Pyrinomonadaceae bacterium]
MISLLKLLAILLLVATNGFFVASEFALVSVRRARLESRAAAGSKNADAALRLIDNPTIFISAVQFGITLASLALGWIGEPTLAALLEPVASAIASEGRAGYIAHVIAIVIAFSLITFLHIVLGELMPKMVALERADRIALFCARPLELFARVFKAPLWIFNTVGANLGRLIGLKSNLDHAAVYTETELRQLIDVARDSGYLRAEERRLIHRVFEFSDTLVREAMVPRTAMAAIPSDSTLEEIARAFEKFRYSRLPVYRESLDDVIGFVHSKDVMPCLLRPRAFRLEGVLQPPLYVVDTARLEDVLRQMQRAKAHFGFVVDEHGGIEGIITLEDLLEEIVGDISDEHDEEVNEQVVLLEDRKYLLAGGLAVRDLNRRLKLTLPESESYTTIAGFLMTEAGHVLKPGDEIKYNGLRFEVDRVERRRVITVRLELPPAAEVTRPANVGEAQSAG